MDSLVFWSVAVFAVLVTGISKGGFGGLALLAVPLLALIMPPVQAAGIMLPILIVMDWVGVWSYRKSWDRTLLMLTLPGAVLGIAAGGLLAGYVDDQFVLLFVGLIAIGFPIYAVLRPQTSGAWLVGHRGFGALSGIASGFTSFVAHAGGPPFQAYGLAQKLDKQTYAGTAVMFFFVVNTIKILPYALLGQFDRTNLTVSLILIPIAPVGVLMGVWLIKRIDQETFYKVMYGLIFAVGLKLLSDVFLA